MNENCKKSFRFRGVTGEFEDDGITKHHQVVQVQSIIRSVMWMLIPLYNIRKYYLPQLLLQKT
jgi:hypothetical protein